MAYIGARPLIGNYQICDALTASATADYTLQVGSVNVVPESANAMIVSLNSVIQGPGASRGFTVSGSTISFNTALTSSDVIDFIYIFGDVLDIGTPTDGTVTAAKLAADAVTTAKILDANVTTAKILDDNVTTAKILDNNVTLAKLGDGTQGDVLYYGASGAPARLGFGTSGDFLKTQGTGANPVWATAGGGKIGQVVQSSIITSVQSTTSTSYVDITGLTLDITPSATSSKIMIVAMIAWKCPETSNRGTVTLLRDTTDLGDASYGLGTTGVGPSGYVSIPMCVVYTDSPSSTSAITYKMQMKVQSSTAYSSFEDCPSQLTALEITA